MTLKENEPVVSLRFPAFVTRRMVLLTKEIDTEARTSFGRKVRF